jgi:hypothetical protein
MILMYARADVNPERHETPALVDQLATGPLRKRGRQGLRLRDIQVVKGETRRARVISATPASPIDGALS